MDKVHRPCLVRPGRWLSISAVSSRATRRPRCRRSPPGIPGLRHQRYSDPEAATIGELVMDKIQRPAAFGRASTRIGARVPTARPALTHAEAFLPISRFGSAGRLATLLATRTTGETAIGLVAVQYPPRQGRAFSFLTLSEDAFCNPKRSFF
jgi:hypothetical protein